MIPPPICEHEMRSAAMKKRTLWRNLLFLTIWLGVGLFALLMIVPNFLGARDAAPNETAAVAPYREVAPASAAPGELPSFSGIAGGSSMPNEGSAESGPTFAAPGAAAPNDVATDGASYQRGVTFDANEAAGGAAPDMPGAPAPEFDPPAVYSSPGGTVGEADAIDDPPQPASAPDSLGGLSGIGEGGGGVGEGIGLGNIGTMGGGSGQNYGYGSGRGGVASHPQAHEITIDATAKPPMPPDAIIAGSDDTMSEVDRKLANLPLGNIAFNTPDSIPFGSTATIELLASLKEAEDELRQSVHGLGPVESAHIKISDQMEAKVTGLGFRIEAITPERQAVSHTQETRWSWQIEPTKSDTLELNLTLSALIKVDGESSARAIRTFEKKILVKVPFTQRVATAMNNNIELITTVVLIPVAGGTWRYVRKRKRGTTPPADNDAEPSRQAA
jgi:hypothetical protein